MILIINGVEFFNKKVNGKLYFFRYTPEAYQNFLKNLSPSDLQLYRESERKRFKAYYRLNKEKIREKQREKCRLIPKIKCECGVVIKNYNHAEHLKTTRHRNLMDGVNCTQRKAQKIKCECGAQVTRGNLIRHSLTRKHWKELNIYVV